MQISPSSSPLTFFTPTPKRSPDLPLPPPLPFLAPVALNPSWTHPARPVFRPRRHNNFPNYLVTRDDTNVPNYGTGTRRVRRASVTRYRCINGYIPPPFPSRISASLSARSTLKRRRPRNREFPPALRNALSAFGWDILGLSRYTDVVINLHLSLPSSLSGERERDFSRNVK